MENRLLTPLQIGDYTLKNRVIMAPLTRMRADADLAPTNLNVEYYRQRSSAGLIITEASQISRLAQGYPMTPGIYSDKQVAGWKKKLIQDFLLFKLILCILEAPLKCCLILRK